MSKSPLCFTLLLFAALLSGCPQKAEPTYSVSPAALSFANGETVRQLYISRTPDRNAVNYSVAADVDWIEIVPAEGLLAAGEQGASVEVRLTHGKESGGTRQGTLSVWVGAGEILVPINVLGEEDAAVTEGEFVDEGEGESFEGEVIVEGEGEVVIEGEEEGEVIVEGEGEMEREGEITIEGEGEDVVEGEGEIGVEGEGETPVEGEGECNATVALCEYFPLAVGNRWEGGGWNEALGVFARSLVVANSVYSGPTEVFLFDQDGNSYSSVAPGEMKFAAAYVDGWFCWVSSLSGEGDEMVIGDYFPIFPTAMEPGVPMPHPDSVAGDGAVWFVADTGLLGDFVDNALLEANGLGALKDEEALRASLGADMAAPLYMAVFVKGRGPVLWSFDPFREAAVFSHATVVGGQCENEGSP